MNKISKNKIVYLFGKGKAEGRADMIDLLGGKGANLAEMTNLGMPVPAGFTITTEVCTHFHQYQIFPDCFRQDVEFEIKAKSYTHCTPALKESYYYRKVYESFFGNQEKWISHFWMPKWVETKDPSARELIGYAE